jgi:hypothetical protein
MIRLQNDELARIFHNQLYTRLLDFCNKHCPELPGEITVNNWLYRVFTNDPTLHIIINHNGPNITEHAVIEIVGSNNCRLLMIHQCQHDNPSLATINEGMEYIDKLAQHINAYSIVFFTAHHNEAFRKHYGFLEARTMMVKLCGNG